MIYIYKGFSFIVCIYYISERDCSFELRFEKSVVETLFWGKDLLYKVDKLAIKMYKLCTCAAQK